MRGRELMWRLFRRELSAHYRQSVFGYVWAVAPAIVTVVTFTYLNRSKILPIGETNLPYPAYVLLGVSVWQLFATGLSKTAQSLVQSRSIIIHINFSRETLVLAVFGESVFNFLIRMVLIVAVFAWFRVVPVWTVFLVPFVLLPLALLTVGFGFILAFTNGVFRDIGNSLTVVLTFAMFLTPVVYPPPTQWPKVLLNYVNPVSPFIIATRDLTTIGVLSQPYGLLWASVFSLLVYLVCWRVFHLAMCRVAERV
ncbi:MAG: ABC transporter permease [Sedimentisphaerales bacterium]|nr:ABC transporter permease [Sedimentisphaerales bacterium]